jgi:hypothetical protein
MARSGSIFKPGPKAPVHICTLPETIVDCFKYRNKIGLDIAIEALCEGWRTTAAIEPQGFRYADSQKKLDQT